MESIFILGSLIVIGTIVYVVYDTFKHFNNKAHH